MSKAELLKYIQTEKHICPKHLKSMGWGKVAELAEEQGIDRKLLENLIILSDAPGEEADKRAGVEIFTKCCPSDDMNKKVNDFMSKNS